MYSTTYTCTPKEFLKGVRIPTRVVATESTMMEEIAQRMYDAIIAKPNQGQTVIICPVGPVAQYPILKINKAHTDLSHVWFINMDEYLTEDGRCTEDAALSFHTAMHNNFYNRILPELRPPEKQCVFPSSDEPDAVDKLLESLGHADVCFTGVGINGHLAFNEPPSTDAAITDEAFAQLPTRVLPISTETCVNNGGRKMHGALDIFPRLCVTLGMKQLLQCRQVKIYLYCDWQWGVMRKLSLEAPSRFCPASFLQAHPDAEMIISQELYECTL